MCAYFIFRDTAFNSFLSAYCTTGIIIGLVIIKLTTLVRLCETHNQLLASVTVYYVSQYIQVPYNLLELPLPTLQNKTQILENQAFEKIVIAYHHMVFDYNSVNIFANNQFSIYYLTQHHLMNRRQQLSRKIYLK